MVFLLTAVLVGLLLPVQAGVNAELRVTLGHPLTTAFVSFLVGTVALGILMVLARAAVPSPRAMAQAPLYQWSGGLLGAIYIAAAVVLAPRLGAATLIASVVTGQMIASLVLDHYGLVGFAEHPIGPGRIVGALLVVAGVILIRR